MEISKWKIAVESEKFKIIIVEDDTKTFHFNFSILHFI